MSPISHNSKEPKSKQSRNNNKRILKKNADGVEITEFNIQSKTKLRWNIRRNNFEEKKKIDPRVLAKYETGPGIETRRIKGKFQKNRIELKEQNIKEVEQESARAELLLTESEGLLEAEEGTYTTHITQKLIRENIDLITASKSFDLKLTNFGPYGFRYTTNGRHVVLGGRMGHLAAFDWLTKKLHFEINVTESIHDVCYLDNENKMAVAQNKWVYTYDNEGIETHCLKKLDRVLKLEYLPYHCLLCCGGETGFISWLDITVGSEIIQFPTRKGPLKVMCQNPFNAVICCGHNNGTVTMWTPNTKEPVASILCHPHPIRAIEVDPTGKYLATASTDRLIKIWDSRNMGSYLQSYRVAPGANNLAFSQKGLLAVGMNNVVEVYKDILSTSSGFAYMRQIEERTITKLQFCPYEDVLGVSTYAGFCSLVIPGCGNPNFDALEVNPYISKTGRREAEVKNLLAKIPSNLITLDPTSILQVDTPTLQEKIDAKSKLIHVKVPKVDLEPRYRMKGKSGSAHKFKRKQKMTEQLKNQFLKEVKNKKEMLGMQKKIAKTDQSPLDRFLPKK